MGSDDDTVFEQPRHRVTVDKPFWISESEINNAAFFAFKPDHNASVFDQQWKDHVRLGYYANYAEQPAVRMSWLDADAFCAWAAKRSGAKVALPTEAQWEWACRAGSDRAKEGRGSMLAPRQRVAQLARVWRFHTPACRNPALGSRRIAASDRKATSFVQVND